MAVIRPPGHHAMYNSCCGYCYVNNVAIAAQMALDKFGLKRYSKAPDKRRYPLSIFLTSPQTHSAVIL